MAAGAALCQGALMGKDESREKRLAEALRENLKRRKAQARGSSEADPASVDDAPSPARR
jgi:hypothetical protein